MGSRADVKIIGEEEAWQDVPTVWLFTHYGARNLLRDVARGIKDSRESGNLETDVLKENIKYHMEQTSDSVKVRDYPAGDAIFHVYVYEPVGEVVVEEAVNEYHFDITEFERKFA